MSKSRSKLFGVIAIFLLSITTCGCTQVEEDESVSGIIIQSFTEAAVESLNQSIEEYRNYRYPVTSEFRDIKRLELVDSLVDKRLENEWFISDI